jgi:hypothetical protein
VVYKANLTQSDGKVVVVAVKVLRSKLGLLPEAQKQFFQS